MLEKSAKIAKNIEKAETPSSRLPPAEFTEEQLCAAVCRESFYDFVQEFWDTIVPEAPVWNWHIEFICGELQRMAERVFKGLPREYDLTVNVSPGSSKTLILSIMFPAWVWTRMRTARIITASYSYDIAVSSSLKSRDLITSDKYKALFPEVQLREDQNAKNHYMTLTGGERYAFGIGGAVTGKHAHFIIVDDPLNPSQAFSSAELQATNRWMEETLPSRKVNKLVTPTILIMQRLAENDPTGIRLEKANKLPHRLICLPAELAENVSPPECRKYYVDGLMDPVRLPYSVLQEIEESQGTFVLASQYGQEPVPRGGLMFMTHKLITDKPPKRFKRMIRAWDKAGTCLIAGTAVTTPDGQRVIESIRKGDLVDTREGAKRVLWAGVKKLTSLLIKVELEDGSTVTGTPDHRIWVQGEGWVELADLSSARYDPDIKSGDVQWRRKRRRTQSSSTEYALLERNAITRHGDGTKSQVDTYPIRCTERSIASTTERFRLDTTFTTKTETPTTTSLATSCLSRRQTTLDSTMLSVSGTKPKKRSNSARGISARGLRQSRSDHLPLTGVSSAETRSNRSIPTPSESSSAEGCVPPACRSVLGRLAIVRDAAGVPRPMAIVSVESIALRTSVPVFDLEVEDAHEFFANGVLVHNSGGGAYSVGVKMAEDYDGHYWVLDVVRGQWDSGARERIMKETAKKDGRAVHIVVEEEPGSGGKQSAQGSVRNLAGFRVLAHKVGKSDGDKEQRADAFSAQVNVGNVYLAKAPWNEAFVNEMKFFPRSKHKDQVDAASSAFNHVAVRTRVAGGRSVRDKQG